MPVRYFIGGPSDGQRQQRVSLRRPKLIGRTSNQMERIAVYQYEGEQSARSGIEFVYRFKFTKRREDAMAFINANQDWL